VKDAAIAAIQGDFSKYTAVGGRLNCVTQLSSGTQRIFAPDTGARSALPMSAGSTRFLMLCRCLSITATMLIFAGALLGVV